MTRRRLTVEYRLKDKLSDGPIRKRELPEPGRIAEIVASWRQCHGLITPDRAAFERILQAPQKNLRDDSRSNKDRLFIILEEIIVEAGKLTEWEKPTQDTYQDAIDTIQDVVAAIDKLDQRLCKLHPPLSYDIRLSGERVTRLRKALSSIDEDTVWRKERAFYARTTERRETKPQAIWRNTVVVHLCGYYELAFKAKASAAQPDGPTIRFLQTCFNEMHAAVMASNLTDGAKKSALKRWGSFPKPDTAQKSLKAIMAQHNAGRRIANGEHQLHASPLVAEWDFASRRWREHERGKNPMQM